MRLIDTQADRILAIDFPEELITPRHTPMKSGKSAVAVVLGWTELYLVIKCRRSSWGPNVEKANGAPPFHLTGWFKFLAQ